LSVFVGVIVCVWTLSSSSVGRFCK